LYYLILLQLLSGSTIQIGNDLFLHHYNMGKVQRSIKEICVGRATLTRSYNGGRSYKPMLAHLLV
jgi:hypothetical protein